MDKDADIAQTDHYAKFDVLGLDTVLWKRLPD